MGTGLAVGLRFMQPHLALLAVALTIGHSGVAGAQTHAPNAKKGKIAVERTLSIYVPQHESNARIFLAQFNQTFAPGKALEQAALDVGNGFFKSSSLFKSDSDFQFNEILVLHSKWDSKDRDSTLTIKYKVLDAAGTVLGEGEKKAEIGTVKLLESNEFYPIALGMIRDILSEDDLYAKISDPHANEAKASAATYDRTLLVSREKPARSGTGFFINDRGQVMTAAHVAHDCPVISIKTDGNAVDGKLVAESLLLDLAVIDSGAPTQHVVPLRTGTPFSLGESVTNIGFPLEGLLAGSPNVTRGNVSSRSALSGSLGQFQFSAPVQPGSSGGPVISETGELLGVTVGTLNVNALIQKGILPQNVNFALDARYAASFMDRYKVAYVSVAANRKSDGRSATDITLPAVVQLLCYQ